MKNLKSHFSFTKQERSGIYFLIGLIIILQLAYFGLSYYFKINHNTVFELNMEHQMKYDSLVILANEQGTFSGKPFNPNYISDFKGYTLGISPEAMDRLQQFRAQGKWVNSADEFQKVTGISDSLLIAISPFFNFPEWVTKKTTKPYQKRVGKKPVFPFGDLNLATSNDLRQINGIGEKLSARIIKFRNRLGGFLVNDQLYDVYGLEPQVVKRVLVRFQVVNPPKVKKININTADIDELAALVYLRYNVAQNIVSYREENGPYTSLDELFNVSGFPVNKIDRIGLYLSL